MPATAINIVFGSVYGNAHYVATELQSAARATGLQAQLIEQPTLPQLLTDTLLIVITSTTGDGELPQRLRPLLQALQAPGANTAGLRYALIALGDSSYTHYCGGGRALSAALDASGAQALAPSLELDACHCLNPEDLALPWALKLIQEHT